MVNRAFTVTTSWQRYTMTFDGDTAENIRNDNGLGMLIIWHLATGPSDIHGASTTFGRTVNTSLYSGVTGQSNFLDNTSNELYLTGCQLEVGGNATEFEHRTIGEELQLCMRYFYRWSSSVAYSNFDIGYATSATNVEVVHQLPVIMRANPALDTSGTFRLVGYPPQTYNNISSISLHRAHPRSQYLRCVTSGLASGIVGEFGDAGSNNATMSFDAEL